MTHQRAIAIDDDPLFLKHIEFLSMEIDWLEVIGTYSHPLHGATAIIKENPDLIFLDIAMPYVDGYALIDWISEKLKYLEKKPKIIVISAQQQPIVEGDEEIDGFIYKPDLRESKHLEQKIIQTLNISL